MAKTQFASKHAPGPWYVYDDNIKFKTAENFGFGTAPKMANIKPKYDFYENDRFIDDPIEADHSRKKKVLAPKIGTEPRMPVTSFSKTPGPDYEINQKPNSKASSKYTFGHRRMKGGQDSLVNKTSTTKTVGPGRYVPEACPNPSIRKDYPKWTLPKAGRSSGVGKTIAKHQTYDTRSSVGKQKLSKNRTGGSAHFGTSSRSKILIKCIF